MSISPNKLAIQSSTDSLTNEQASNLLDTPKIKNSSTNSHPPSMAKHILSLSPPTPPSIVWSNAWSRGTTGSFTNATATLPTNPSSCTPFPYNDTIAQEYMPLTKDQVIHRGFQWRDKIYEINLPPQAETIIAKDLPNNIHDIDDSITQKIIICSTSWRPFRIMPYELWFYRTHHIPLPTIHPDLRHAQRVEQKPARKQYLRTCDKCGKEILTVYPSTTNQIMTPDNNTKTQQKVYCEHCYQKQIYG